MTSINTTTPHDNDSSDLKHQIFGNDNVEDREIVEENSDGKTNNKVKPQKTKGKDNENKREEYFPKYSDGLLLAEVILIAGQPYFLLVSQNKEEISIVPSIELEDKS